VALTGTKKLTKGEFTMAMTPAATAAGSPGEYGHIKFKPYATAARTDSLRLVQVLQLVEKSTGHANVWAGTEASRNNALTTADPGRGVEGGFSVDVLYAGRTPRANASDPAVSPYYTDDYKARPDAAGNWEDGWQKGGTDQKEAILRDFPNWTNNSTYKFETAAKAQDTGVIYGTIKWQFSIDGGVAKNSSWDAFEAESATFDAAVDKFNETMHNPGASTAPRPPAPAPSPDAGVPDAGPEIRDAGESLPGGVRQPPPQDAGVDGGT
jgi:hypothetical protein